MTLCIETTRTLERDRRGLGKLETTVLKPSSGGSAVDREDNKLRLHDRAAHQWYRFVLS